MPTTQEQIADYYVAKLIQQYYDKPNAQGTIAALVSGTGNYGIIAAAIYTQVRDGFDLTTAIGQQLDFIGKLRGVTRYFFGLNLSKTFTALTTYGAPDMNTVLGISTYELPQPPGWYTMTYEDFVENTLNDGQFRRVIQFLADVHSCDYAYATLDAICYKWFGTNVNLVNNKDMTITYQHLTSDTDDLFEIINQMALLPAPAGVSYTVQEVPHF